MIRDHLYSLLTVFPRVMLPAINQFFVSAGSVVFGGVEL